MQQDVLAKFHETNHVALTARNHAMAAREAETKEERELANIREEWALVAVEAPPPPQMAPGALHD